MITANKSNHEDWNLKKIISDCYQMASKLTEHATEIRERKASSFTRNMKQVAEEMRVAHNLHQLYQWMKENAFETKIVLVKNLNL